MNEQDRILIEGRQDPERVRSMFNAIAPTYDTLNHVISGGLDILWRRKAISLLESKRGGRILDIASGSGDLAVDALALAPELVVSTDFALEMLRCFADKIDNRQLNKYPISLAGCDAMRLPFADESFDVAMVAFGIRNFADRVVALREMHRVLRPGGISLILELGVPHNPIVRAGYTLYTRGLLPLMGKIISRHNEAYTYLPASIARFSEPAEFRSLMESAGFTGCAIHPLTFGVANIFTGIKKT